MNVWQVIESNPTFPRRIKFGLVNNMDRLNNIIVGVDFSDFSRTALEQAMRMARWNQSDLHVMHVLDKLVVKKLSKAMGGSLEELSQNILDTTRQRIQELFISEPLEQRKESPLAVPSDTQERRQSDQRRIDLKVEVVIGEPFRDIMLRVQDVHADLLVLGSNGMSDPRRGLGELATQCVRKAPCRVMVVRKSQVEPFSDVLAYVDFSDSSAKVVEQAIRVAGQDKARLHLAHMFMPPWNILHYKSPTAAGSPDFQKQYRENLLGQLKKYLQKHEDDTKDLRVECQLVEGPRPLDGIIDYAQKNSVDLVLVGTCGKTGMKEKILGTLAERIVNHAPVSVLVLKPENY